MSQEKGVESTPTVRFQWIAAQWAWIKTEQKRGVAERLRVTMTFMLPEEVGTRQRPHKITFNLTNRHREFRGANLFQEHVKSLAVLAGHRWIGKARLRRNKNEEVQDHHRRNIPDLVMSAWTEENTAGQGYLVARLWTPIEQIRLEFTVPLTQAQKQHYDGSAMYGTRPRPPRARDDFYDWIRYA
jgi:hypothetical protein